MNRTRRIIFTRVLAFAFITSIMCAVPIHHDGQVNPLVIHYGVNK